MNREALEKGCERGILGLVLGTPPERMWMVGPLHFGTSDHAIHILLGILFLAGGLFTKKT